MKFFLLFFFFISSFFSATGQNENSDSIKIERIANNFWGMALNFNNSTAYGGIYLSPEVNYYLNAKHNLFVSPNFLIIPDALKDQTYFGVPQNPRNFSDRLGVNLGYRYYFLPVGKRVNFALMYNLQYNRAYYSYYNDLIQFSTNLISHTLGYNLKIRLYDNFYLNQEMGIGRFHKATDFKFNKPGIYLNAGIGYWFRK